ncbi:MAG: pantoate--beta-alanine ligase [Magnetococcales bacterium]|nr:pantoate--beta-alanine ligase [Magnetococcales bacterium]MBF0439163.1 pantoate--beta-alanine ligase [Magnetococcales bacterium]
MKLLTDLSSLTQWTASCRAAGGEIGFVPTMGALHLGHMALIHAARKACAHVVASIFVNPTQFGPNEDFARYPRTLDQDRQLLAEAGCDALFVPEAGEIYPVGFQTSIHIELGNSLCGRMRPGHFDGVAVVVTILLNRVRPDVAFFGLKDYQQFLLIRRLVGDLAMPVRVVGIPTVREADGLAMSSRNRYLTADERQRAGFLYQALMAARQAYRQGERDVQVLEALSRRILESGGVDGVEYIELRDAQTLEPVVVCRDNNAPVMLVAARVGGTRLIDNMVLSIVD